MLSKASTVPSASGRCWVFQDVAKSDWPIPVGRLATFDRMFEGIRTALKSNVQQSILIAERNLGDDFATRVLKALFLVKYVKAFKATPRNIAILLLERFDIDQTKHRQRSRGRAGPLEQKPTSSATATLRVPDRRGKGRRAGDQVESGRPAEIARELQTLIFDSASRSRKIRHDASGQDFAFAERLDDNLVGRDYELSINVMTPFHDDHGNESQCACGPCRATNSRSCSPRTRVSRRSACLEEDRQIRPAKWQPIDPSRR